jgi:hypothetical protein
MHCSKQGKLAWVGVLLSASVWFGAAARVKCEQATLPNPDQLEFFEKHIRPVLAERCYPCHSAKAGKTKAGLSLDSAAGVLRGGESGPVIVPGKPSESALISAIRYESNEMPPDGRLSNEIVADFVHWVETGAFDPRTEAAGAAPSEPAPQKDGHWAFRNPVIGELPAVQNASWVATDVDRFILARLEQANVAPSPPASPRALLRRLYYDLTGLPPQAEEADRFAAGQGADYAAVVDSLLASPRFGERWGRHWMDVARYADTKGYVFQEDRNYPKAYLFRDWVIQAFNNDMPYDQFITNQLAADQVDPSQAAAMGFLTLGRRFINNKNDIIDDRIDVVTRGLMGVTVTCARCHDHKYDPVTMADYYGMYGVFDSSREPAEASAPLMMVDESQPREPVIFLRGNPSNRGPQVPRKFLACLCSGDPVPYRHGSGRREMASMIASTDNPLTARVWVNRVWLHLVGRGLVTTPSDFGSRSDPPSHPELLDWLACRFMQEHWSTKWLVRQIVMSQAYRQACDDRADGAAADPENRLVWRMNRRRMDLESIRDGLLTAAGRLDLTMGGPSVPLTEPPFATRRSVYGFIERQNLPNFFRIFDFAGPDTHNPARPYTTVPQQALFLMNSPFAIEQASNLAARSTAAGGGNTTARIKSLYRFALARDASDEETALCAHFVEVSEPAAAAAANADPWQYGWGRFVGEKGITQFNPLPHFTGSAWQGGKDLPDPQLGWVMLNAPGGHPGNDLDHAAIRRFVVPQSGRLVIRGSLHHPAEQGDGVVARVVRQNGGIVKEFTAHHSTTPTDCEPLTVGAGESIDLLVDCGAGGNNSDGFSWTVTIRWESEKGDAREWSSEGGFHGSPPPPLDRWTCLAQVLLMSNEFHFVD